MVAAVRYYVSRGFPNLKENTVRDWRNAYRLELTKRARDRSDEVSEGGISISDLPQKKRGRDDNPTKIIRYTVIGHK